MRYSNINRVSTIPCCFIFKTTLCDHLTDVWYRAEHMSGAHAKQKTWSWE